MHDGHVRCLQIIRLCNKEYMACYSSLSRASGAVPQILRTTGSNFRRKTVPGGDEKVLARDENISNEKYFLLEVI